MNLGSIYKFGLMIDTQNSKLFKMELDMEVFYWSKFTLSPHSKKGEGIEEEKRKGKRETTGEFRENFETTKPVYTFLPKEVRVGRLRNVSKSKDVK
jgi:hypothetical protein